MYEYILLRKVTLDLWSLRFQNPVRVVSNTLLLQKQARNPNVFYFVSTLQTFVRSRIVNRDFYS